MPFFASEYLRNGTTYRQPSFLFFQTSICALLITFLGSAAGDEDDAELQDGDGDGAG